MVGSGRASTMLCGRRDTMLAAVCSVQRWAALCFATICNLILWWWQIDWSAAAGDTCWVNTSSASSQENRSGHARKQSSHFANMCAMLLGMAGRVRLKDSWEFTWLFTMKGAHIWGKEHCFFVVLVVIIVLWFGVVLCLLFCSRIFFFLSLHFFHHPILFRCRNHRPLLWHSISLGLCGLLGFGFK